MSKRLQVWGGYIVAIGFIPALKYLAMDEAMRREALAMAAGIAFTLVVTMVFGIAVAVWETRRRI